MSTLTIPVNNTLLHRMKSLCCWFLITFISLTFTLPPEIPLIFYTIIRPWTFGGPIKHQLTAWMFANLTQPDKPLIAELDCPYNTTDPPFLFTIFINSIEDTYYFIDGTVCTKTPKKVNDAFGFPPFVTASIVTAELISKFNLSDNKTLIATFSKCPGHPDDTCHQWLAQLDNGDELYAFVDGKVLLRMSLNNIATFTLDYDGFMTDNPFGVNDYKPPKDVHCKLPFS